MFNHNELSTFRLHKRLTDKINKAGARSKLEQPSAAAHSSGGVETFDLVIIGGGIVGSSVAYKAAEQGFSVLLAEQDDFGRGASGRSSRLLHCGLRYFEAPQPIRYFATHPKALITAFRQARNAMKCRADFANEFPDLVTPLDFSIPIYKDGPFKSWQVDLAFNYLNLFAGPKTPLNYRRLSRQDALKEPLVASLHNKEKLHSVAFFTEYQFRSPERICVNYALGAEAMSAVVLNRTKAELGDKINGARQVHLTTNGEKSTSKTVRAKMVIVASGQWIDEILSCAKPDIHRKVLGTKGGHIVLTLPPKYRGKGATTFNSLHEPFYCIPWLDRHYIGPTETIYSGDPNNISVDGDDFEFLVSEANKLFPGLKITKDMVEFTWAGVRPLTYDPNFPKGSRETTVHDLKDQGLDRVWAVTAAPIMSHQIVSKNIVDNIGGLLQPSGAAKQPDSSFPGTELPEAQDSEALRRAFRTEHAKSISDVLYRRSDLGWQRRLSKGELQNIADLGAEELGWSAARKKAEIKVFLKEDKKLFGAPDYTS